MVDTLPEKPVCLYCKEDSAALPLIQLHYQDTVFWICPQHLPILIHKPALLTGMLPGAEYLQQAEHHD
ncbi:MAG: hypothetical protein JXQ72_09820 [Anaerolineae bacterium]|nr:hypothetical protein [Anaerolineae bacterium]